MVSLFRVLAGCALALLLLIPPAHGQAFTVHPDTATVLKRGEWTLRYVIPAGGMAASGGLKVRLGPGFGKPQSTNPNGNTFVLPRTSRPSVGASVAGIALPDESLDWDFSFAAWVVTLRPGGPLGVGDTLLLDLQRFVPPLSSFVLPIEAAVDLDGDGGFTRLAAPALLDVRPRDPARLVATMPSTLWVGAGFELHVAVFDLFDNLTPRFSGAVTFSSTDPLADLPAPHTFTPADSAFRRFPVTFRTPGIHRVTVRAEGRSPDSLWTVRSNPFEVYSEEPPEKIYWGDLHSHSAISPDGLGTGAFEYARDATRLDFFAPADHSGSERGMTDAEWDETRDRVRRFHAPGQFVTILGYEFSAAAPYGHHNVYFDALNANFPSIPLLRTATYRSTPNLWAALAASVPAGVRVLTIPHHTGVIFPALAPGADAFTSFHVDFGPTSGDSTFRRNIELYSNHGLSEAFDPDHPLAYEQLFDNGKRSRDGPNYAQDAWALGEHLSVIASTDDHTARPGLRGRGLAAVLAPRLTRVAVFDALFDRHTYGTTGDRILLDFRLNDASQGSIVTRPADEDEPLTLSVRAAGTGEIDFIEVLRWAPPEDEYHNGHPAYEVIYRHEAGGDDADFSVVDSSGTASALYYVRLKQRAGIFSHRDQQARASWAWSSPIWVRTETPEPASEVPEPEAPADARVEVYPNPTASEVTTHFTLDQPRRVRIRLYDVMGRVVRLLADADYSAGRHTLAASVDGVPAGVYLLRLEAGSVHHEQSVIILP